MVARSGPLQRRDHVSTAAPRPTRDAIPPLAVNAIGIAASTRSLAISGLVHKAGLSILRVNSALNVWLVSRGAAASLLRRRLYPCSDRKTDILKEPCQRQGRAGF